MQANITIATKQTVFPSGTIGGEWLWKLAEVKPEGVNSEWTTIAPKTSVEVDDNFTYEICGQRVDPQGELLGSSVCTIFRTGDEPGDVVIDTAESITVEVV